MLWSIVVNTHVHMHTFIDSGPLVFLIKLIIELLMLVSGLPTTIDLSGKDISCNDAI